MSDDPYVDLVDFLTSDSDIAEQVGQRVYPEAPPAKDAEYPCIAYQVIGRPGLEATHDDSGGLSAPIVSLHVWATTYARSHRLANSVRAALRGYRGWIRNESDRPVGDVSDRLHRVVMDVELRHEEGNAA